MLRHETERAQLSRRGESVASLIKDPPPSAPVPPILPPQQGSLMLDKSKFVASFAADVAPEKAEFMANSQVPWGLDALNGAVTQPAWQSKPSWYLVATDDRMIPPPAQRAMSKRAGPSVVEVKAVTRSTFRSRRPSQHSIRRRPTAFRQSRFVSTGAGRGCMHCRRRLGYRANADSKVNDQKRRISRSIAGPLDKADFKSRGALRACGESPD
jgi:hypothetical protein